MGTLLAITPCQDISDFHTLGEKRYACHHPLPAKPPSRHHFFSCWRQHAFWKNVMASNTSGPDLEPQTPALDSRSLRFHESEIRKMEVLKRNEPLCLQVKWLVKLFWYGWIYWKSFQNIIHHKTEPLASNANGHVFNKANLQPRWSAETQNKPPSYILIISFWTSILNLET